MIYTIGNQKLNITEKETKQDKGTPNQIVGWRDVAETCRTIHAVSSVIPVKDPFIVDGIARAGFWAAVYRSIWKKCKLHLNDLDDGCLDVLHRNFPESKITNKSVKDFAPKSCDISNLDFAHFTLKILDKWIEVVKAWAENSRYLILADGACFGFKFGNMRHYGITDELEYYYLLDEALSKHISKRITTVSKFTNAASILLEDTKKPKKIKFIQPTPDLLLMKGSQKHKVKKETNYKALF